MEFKSQIATTREQSEQLLALGLKPDTEDMYLEKCMLPEAGNYYLHSLTRGIAYVWMALYVYRMCNKLVDLFW